MARKSDGEIRTTAIILRGNVNSLTEMLRTVGVYNQASSDVQVCDAIDQGVKGIVDANEKFQQACGNRVPS